MTGDAKLANLGSPRRIWAVAACRGPIERLDRLHIALSERFARGDRLIYLGNYLGTDVATLTIDRLLAFRSYLLAWPGMIPNDFVYLRGSQEEIWSKMLQIQFAPNPVEVLRWMLDRGGHATLAAYGGDAAEGLLAAREGAVAMARWTNQLRESIRLYPGHQTFMSVLRQAACTEPHDGQRVLFVHSGLEPSKPLALQGDSFWWNADGFCRVTQPFEDFARLVRGFDPMRLGTRLDGYAVTLDGDGDRTGPLIAAALAPDGQILDIIKA